MIPIGKIGKIGRTYGKDGELRVYPDDDYIPDLKKAKAIFAFIKGSKVPFVIEKITDKNEDLILKLKGLDSPEEVTILSNQELYLHQDEIFSEPSSNNSQYDGFGVYLNDSDAQIGVLLRIEEHPHQLIAILLSNDKEYMLPFHEDLILSLNTEDKTIKFDYNHSIMEI